ncbi:acylneuraminate cytidylyltransferase [Rufibacter hautae]|uniref:N-acylneuraminate cytidylyltransferase n=1 Tax=Rufibacter hautae TaxID=2595005 RepID=A0A5B6TBV5_9BACT|nr:acylneuraminate cytidylyltransferase [Rufibacter hautae]KAA3436583.1 acylneuraminate cytidylyltransferase [Rufibacter hautae]
MKTVAVIPARGGSKSIPLKNIKSFCGKPLIYWNLKALEDASRIDKVYVATDSDKIEEVVLGFGFSKAEIFRRSDANAQDTSSTESVLLEFISKEGFSEDTAIILVQATSPLTQAEDFDKAIGKYEAEEFDSLLTCARIKRFVWSADGAPINYNYLSRPRRQDFEGLLLENGAFYINTVGNIKRERNRLSGKIGIYEMPEYTSTELDEDDDWIVVEMLMQKHFSKNLSKPKIKMFLSDIDGVLTDAGMYYSEHGDELKKFCTYDGKGFELLRNAGIKTGVVTAENRQLNQNRAEKLKLDFVYQGVSDKLSVVKKLCEQEGISLDEVAYIGDDLNDIELLNNVGVPATPSNAFAKVKQIPNILLLNKKGGEGAVREFVEILLGL